MQKIPSSCPPLAGPSAPSVNLARGGHKPPRTPPPPHTPHQPDKRQPSSSHSPLRSCPSRTLLILHYVFDWIKKYWEKIRPESRNSSTIFAFSVHYLFKITQYIAGPGDRNASHSLAGKLVLRGSFAVQATRNKLLNGRTPCDTLSLAVGVESRFRVSLQGYTGGSRQALICLGSACTRTLAAMRCFFRHVNSLLCDGRAPSSPPQLSTIYSSQTSHARRLLTIFSRPHHVPQSVPCVVAWNHGPDVDPTPPRSPGAILCVRFSGSVAKTRPKPPPTGTVHCSPAAASQFTVMMGDVLRYQPAAIL